MNFIREKKAQEEFKGGRDFFQLTRKDFGKEASQ